MVLKGICILLLFVIPAIYLHGRFEAFRKGMDKFGAECMHSGRYYVEYVHIMQYLTTHDLNIKFGKITVTKTKTVAFIAGFCATKSLSYLVNYLLQS